ncbi:MAG: universal stress protein [Deltaproteobacteria bacterium]|nr:universal stress protein [Deltaproteobacteria bacterium]
MALRKVEIDRILFATDLSDHSRYAFAYAVSLANLYEAQLIILHVQSDEPWIDEKLTGDDGEKKWEEVKNQNLIDAREVLIGKKKQSETIRRVLNHFCDGSSECFGENGFIKDEILIKSGDPTDEILAQVAEKKCGLIVIGGYGQEGNKEKGIGATVEQVLKRSNVPVMMVRLPEEEEG